MRFAPAGAVVLLAIGCGEGEPDWPFRGSLAWAKGAGSSDGDHGLSVAVLADGCSFVTGYFEGVATFGSGEANETNLTSAGYYDIFIARYDPAGSLSWARRAGGTEYDGGRGLAVLPDGSSFVTGYFEGTTTFGVGESNETNLTSAGYYDIFIARYAPDGTLSWAKRAGGVRYDAGYGVAVLRDGSSFVTGNFVDTATFGPGESNETSLTSAGVYDIFIARYDPDGALSWARRAGGRESDAGHDVAALPDGSFLITGYIKSTATFGPGEPNETGLTSAGGLDIFVASYGSDGALSWATRAGGIDHDLAHSVAVLPDGASLITGHFWGTATFGSGEANETSLVSPGYNDVFVSRYDADGLLSWAKRAGGAASEQGCGVAVLPDGSSFVTGYFEGTGTFGPGEPNETTLTSKGGNDIFVARYDRHGSLCWVKRSGGDDYEVGRDVAIPSDRSPLVTGYFQGKATFGPGEAHETSLTSAGGSDIFIARYRP